MAEASSSSSHARHARQMFFDVSSKVAASFNCNTNIVKKQKIARSPSRSRRFFLVATARSDVRRSSRLSCGGGLAHVDVACSATASGLALGIVVADGSLDSVLRKHRAVQL